MKISASIKAWPSDTFVDTAQQITGSSADHIHLDCRKEDDLEADLQYLRSISDKPIDIHLVQDDPCSFFNLFEKYKIEYVSVQFEICNSFVTPEKRSFKFGISIMPETPLDVISNCNQLPDFVVFTSTLPGYTGGKFYGSTVERVYELLNHYPEMEIHVDGGVDEAAVAQLSAAGVKLVVSGSYLMKHANIEDGLHTLRSKILINK